MQQRHLDGRRDLAHVPGPGDREPTASVITDVTALLLLLPRLTLERLAALVERENRVQLGLKRYDNQNVNFQGPLLLSVSGNARRRQSTQYVAPVKPLVGADLPSLPGLYLHHARPPNALGFCRGW